LSQREELVFLLNHAAELEHSLACAYLFAGFSLKGMPDEGLGPEVLKSVRGWKRQFAHVAVEEMFHFAVVNNLLTAIGAAPHFDRPNFPHGCAYYLPEYQIELQPFTLTSLDHFIAIEQPDGSNIPAILEPSRLQRILGELDNEIGPGPAEFDSQGDVYTAVADRLQAIVARRGEENVFLGPPPSPALRQFLESSGYEPITDLASTIRVLDHVVEQGEGASHSTPDSHFGRFQAIREEYMALKQQDPEFEPGRPVMANPFARTPPESWGPVNIIDDPFAVQVSDLFNETYGAMLQILGRFFLITDESEDEANALCNASIDVMVKVLGPLGELLTRLPAGPSHPGRNAGPSFVVHTMHPLPHHGPAWRLLRERLEELADHTEALDARSGEIMLKPVGGALRKIEASLAFGVHQ
jgi:hypothetical protein